MILFLILFAVTIIEIILFVQVDQAIGLGWTISIVFATAVIGAVALRRQGFSVMRRLQTMSALDDVSVVVVDGILILSSGLLLVTPGFLTDAIGFSLLVPTVRRMIGRYIGRRMVVHAFGGHSGMAGRSGGPAGGPAGGLGGGLGGGSSPFGDQHQPSAASGPATADRFRDRPESQARRSSADDAVVLPTDDDQERSNDRGGSDRSS